MKIDAQIQARKIRTQGMSIGAIASQLGVSKSSVSLWVRDIKLSARQNTRLQSLPFTTEAVEKRRQTRLSNEETKRSAIIAQAHQEIDKISDRELWLMGVMLYWAEGGKTRRMVCFSNGDPRIIKIMMLFFRKICLVPEEKFRGYIHIHSHLDHENAEQYWSEIADIPDTQFFKTYRRTTSGHTGKNSLPYGVMDIYVLDSGLFLKISGWAAGIFEKTK